ncbi:hypothetical protein [Nocardioides sp. URHA0020]|uniref:hypothetical protein n=1 Tax=Nocardioides sp. URHA0020 TaxID=1380392 RepID=UPI00049028F4|nr:hypothetical protein [Nocardioides sp. URHA0020]
MDDARDGITVEDSIGSAKPPRPPRPAGPRDPGRHQRLLLWVIAAAAVAAAAFTGVTAWETHQHREMDQALYCQAYADSNETEDQDYVRQQDRLREALGC